MSEQAVSISRHFVSIQGKYGHRQVHYRRAGDGPCLVLLHQSPQSSLEYVGLMQEWGQHFTVIAPDTPGYGASDPVVGDDLTMADFADCVAEFIRALGIRKTGLYGFHTGAAMAVETAARHPSLVTAVAGNGYGAFNAEEQADLLANYLPAFVPAFDGSHLAWLWTRLRQQLMFFPWYDLRAATRMSYDLPSPEHLQKEVLEFLRAGDNYRTAYGCAFAHDGSEAVVQLAVPGLVTAWVGDVLASQLERIPSPPAGVAVYSSPTRQAALDNCFELLAAHPAPTPPASPPAQALKGRLWSEMVSIPGGQVRVYRNTDADGATVVVQHDAAGSGRTVQELAESLIGSHPVLAVELPGHGDSDNTIGEGDVSVADYREALVQVLDALGLDMVNGYGVWGGGSVLLDMAIAHPGRVGRLVVTGLIDHTPEEQEDLLKNYAPEIKPEWHGGHLLAAWHMMRDQGVYFPWYSRKAATQLKGEPYLDADMVHRRVVEVLRSPVMWRKAYHAHFRYRTGQRLADAGIPVLLATAEWDVARELSERLASEYAHVGAMLLPDNPAQWGAAVTPFLNS
ncbi:alpha/beta hydrolase [Candidatus Foliamicus sp.]